MFQSPLVVGYKGEIGSFILNGLLKTLPKANNIWCFDINESEEEKIERIRKSDYIFLCVPLQDTVEWLIKYKPYLENKIIVEQCSLKGLIFNDNRINDLHYISMHLLFRPSATPNKEDRRCIVIDENNYQFMLFADMLSETLDIEIEPLYSYTDHDETMAENQALVHRVILALVQTLKNPRVDTYVSRTIRDLARRIEEGDETLYKMIQENKYLDDVLVKFENNLRR